MSSETVTAEPAAASVPINPFRALRVWPVVVVLLAMLVTRIIPLVVDDGPPMIWMSSSFGPLVGSGLLLLWWLGFSRAITMERVLGAVGVISALAVTALSSDPSMFPVGLALLTIPLGMALFGVSAVALGRMRSIQRTFLIVLATAAGFSSTLLLRSDGMDGSYTMSHPWRWEPTVEEQLVANLADRAGEDIGEFSADTVGAWLAHPEWPSFRGSEDNAQHTGCVISSDWSATPPQEVWKIPVGPAWSSFAVAGKLLFTQEQRDTAETVVCYHTDTGKEIWTQQVEARFEEPLGGPGPRATPALSGEALFVQGANGDILKLGPRTGEIIWRRDLKELADRMPLEWGFSSSPLVLNDQVIVYGGGKGKRGVISLDAESGEELWSAAAGNHSYSSPRAMTILETQYVAMLTNEGLHLYDPESGAVRLNYKWPFIGYRAVQPRAIGSCQILIPTGPDFGTRCIEVSTTDKGQLTADIQWDAKRLKPDFNDFIVYNDHAYGFDNKVIACISLKTGKPRWKGGRYGKGQMLLLADSGLLLILGEAGQLVLLKADPSGHQELAKIQVLDSKTWNHPVLIGDRLFIRNDREAACWILPTAEQNTTVRYGPLCAQ